jgi:chromatin remodeling complex protein RSC6
MSTEQIPINTKQTKQTKQAKQAKQAVLEDKIETIAPDVVQVQLEKSEKKEKKTAKQETIEVVNESEGEVVDSALEHEETYESYDDVFKAINDIDREMTKLNRKRIQLSKILNKFHTKETKQLKKKTKTPGDNSNRKKSGFNKPTRVPTAFCNYLSLDPDIELPRTNVTALLYRHIKELGMNSKEDGRVINPDEALRQLFMRNPDETLKFENFQHFVARVYKAENSDLSESLINVKTDNVVEESDEDEEEECDENELEE